MASRERLARIATVRRMRETQERTAARRVADGVAALEKSARRISRIEETSRWVRRELASRMEAGTDAWELLLYHDSWKRLRERKRLALEEHSRREAALNAAREAYLSTRIERKKAETWERNVGTRIRDEEEMQGARQMDELAVIRRRW
ncbi:MAG: hypothetical protein Kow00128_00590 [Deltaproteobacteria bacterium]